VVRRACDDQIHDERGDQSASEDDDGGGDEDAGGEAHGGRDEKDVQLRARVLRMDGASDEDEQEEVVASFQVRQEHGACDRIQAHQSDHSRGDPGERVSTWSGVFADPRFSWRDGDAWQDGLSHCCCCWAQELTADSQ